MDVVELPIVEHTALVGDAIARLREQRCAGVVVEWPDAAHSLLYAGHLYHARDRQVRHVSEVPGIHMMTLVDRPTLAERFHINVILDLLTPFKTATAYRDLFDRAQVAYAVAGTEQGRARVVTRSELFAHMLNMTGGYECNGRPRHYFPDPSVSNGQTCPLYPECSRPDAIVPTIHPIP